MFCRRQLLQSTQHGCDEEDGGRGSPRNLCDFPDDRQVCSTGKAGRHPLFVSLLLLFQIKVSDFLSLFYRTLKMASSWMSMSRCLLCVISCPGTLNSREATMQWASPKGHSFCEWLLFKSIHAKCNCVVLNLYFDLLIFHKASSCSALSRSSNEDPDLSRWAASR